MKNLLFAFTFVSLATPVFSQFHIGLSAGANMSFWAWEIKSLDTDIDYEPAMGWRSAVLSEWQMNPILGLRAEFGTQVKANKRIQNLIFETDLLAGDFDGTPWAFREFFLYWEGSLLAQISPLKKCPQLYLLAGTTAGRLEKAWNTGKGSEAEMKHSSKNSIDIKGAKWNRNAFAADFGLGGNIPLGSNSKIYHKATTQNLCYRSFPVSP